MCVCLCINLPGTLVQVDGVVRVALNQFFLVSVRPPNKQYKQSVGYHWQESAR